MRDNSRNAGGEMRDVAVFFSGISVVFAEALAYLV